MENKNFLNSINKAVKYLKNKQNNNGSICLNGDTTWDVWETANAIISINLVGSLENNDILNRATKFLLNSKREDHSYYPSSIYKKNEYGMETTPFTALALHKMGVKTDKIINFILNKQHPDGSWDIGVPEVTKRRHWPSVTGSVLYSLLSIGIKSKKIDKGIDYLINSQNDDGSWGSNWVYYDSPYYPTHVILPSLKLYGLENSNTYTKAIEYIISTQKKDGSWNNKTNYKYKPSIEMRTALALNSLLVNSIDSEYNKIKKGIDWLINTQKSDGHWSGGYFVGWGPDSGIHPGKKEDIYTTSLALRAFMNYKKNNEY